MKMDTDNFRRVLWLITLVSLFATVSLCLPLIDATMAGYGPPDPQFLITGLLASVAGGGFATILERHIEWEKANAEQSTTTG